MALQAAKEDPSTALALPGLVPEIPHPAAAPPSALKPGVHGSTLKQSRAGEENAASEQQRRLSRRVGR